MNNFTDVALYFGGSIEGRNIYDNRDDIAFSNSIIAVSLFLGANSVFGPLFLAIGFNDEGNEAIYLSLSRPFIYKLGSVLE